MKKLAISTFLAAVMLLSAWAVALPTAGAVQSTSKIEFSLEEILEDYDQLWADLGANYPFFTVLERRKINVEGLRQSNREVLANRITDLNGFMSLLRDTFSRMDNLAHLSLVDVDLYDFYDSSLPLESLSENDPEVELIFSAQTQFTYELLGAKGASTAISYPEVELRYLSDIIAAYFHFKSFRYPLIERDKGIVADYLSSLGDVDHIIIDITGNSGGAYAYWMYNIVSPFGGKYVWENYTFLKMSPVNKRFFSNNLSNFKPLSDLPSDYEIPPFVHELGLTHFYDSHSTYPAEDYTGKLVETQAKRWVLIDQGAFSAADNFAAFCKNSCWATLVGKTTWGDGANAFGPVMIALKNTGLLVRFSSTTAANSDGTMNAEVGTAPDIVCKRGETPLDTCLRVITNKP